MVMISDFTSGYLVFWFPLHYACLGIFDDAAIINRKTQGIRTYPAKSGSLHLAKRPWKFVLII